MCTSCKTVFVSASWNLQKPFIMFCKADVQSLNWNHISLFWNWKSNAALSSWSKRIVSSYSECVGKLVSSLLGVRRERDWEVLPSIPLWGNCIYLFLILTGSCTFLHTHFSLKYVHFSPTSSYGNRNMGSFFPTKYYLFCINCLYFSSIANRLFSHLLCVFWAFLQNEKIVDECPCIFFVLFPFQETGKTVNGLYIIAYDSFPLFCVYLLYEIKPAVY